MVAPPVEHRRSLTINGKKEEKMCQNQKKELTKSLRYSILYKVGRQTQDNETDWSEVSKKYKIFFIISQKYPIGKEFDIFFTSSRRGSLN